MTTPVSAQGSNGTVTQAFGEHYVVRSWLGAMPRGGDTVFCLNMGLYHPLSPNAIEIRSIPLSAIWEEFVGASIEQVIAEHAERQSK